VARILSECDADLSYLIVHVSFDATRDLDF
jgi:hypothetical protein